MYFVPLTIVSLKIKNLRFQFTDFIICRQCGTDASLSNFLVNKQAASTVDSKNITLFNKTGILIQELENPVGARFQVVTVKTAFCAKIYSVNTPQYTMQLTIR